MHCVKALKTCSSVHYPDQGPDPMGSDNRDYGRKTIFTGVIE